MFIGLELFSGSKLISATLQQHGFLMLSVDNNPKLSPSICCDIRDLERDQFPGNVAFIWASVPCTTFSRAASSFHFSKHTIKYRQYEYTCNTAAARTSVELLEKTIEILSWFPSAWFVIENPVGRIRHFEAMKNLGHYFYQVNYADFGFSYSKETCLFTNFLLPLGSKRVIKFNHPGKFPSSAFEKSKVPPALVQFLLQYLPISQHKTKVIKSSKNKIQS